MLEGIRQIGKTYRESLEKGFVFSLIQEVPRREGQKYLLGMDFWPREERIELSFPELDDRVIRDYLWVGNCKGNVPQDRLTTSEMRYLALDSLKTLGTRLKRVR